MRQFKSSPVIQTLVEQDYQDFNPETFVEDFYNKIWNIDTADTLGLDIWGRIVNIGRYLEIPGELEAFGFDTGIADWSPFNDQPFATREHSTDTYRLTNDAYRKLILAKAMSNVFCRSCQEINQMLMLLFHDRGNSYVLDLGSMRMRYVFEFTLEPFERAIVHNTEIFARPAGVLAEVKEIPSFEFFGFAEAGDDYLPFNDGTFYAG